MTQQASAALDYRPAPGFFDELFEAGGRPRPPAAALTRTLGRLGRVKLRAAGERRDAIFVQQGITFDASGPDGPTRDRPFPLDLVPRILPADEWRVIKRGLAQRVRALNAFVDDVYHDQEIVREGIVPWELVVTRPAFARAGHGIRPPGGVWCHVAGCNLVRDADGRWKVLEDNVRTPSGVSYLLENRIAMSRLLPELFAGYDVRPVSQYPALLLDALRTVAPGGGANPVVVVWTPGSANSAYFEHAFLARQMGVELVEASDLVVREAVCYMRTTRGLARVDSIYRRIDDAFMDPLEFRPDSLLGVPSLMGAYRAGNVAIANAIGTGVADDKAVYHYVPEMIRHYLGEEPILDNLPTWLLADAEQRAEVLERLHELVVKPTGESGGKGVFIGPLATEEQLAAQRLVIEQAPERWIAQHSTVDDLLEGGAGVCQDFVHLGLILLRQQQIAARYVSGYLFAAPDDGGADSVEVDTHAWLEALIPGTDGGAAEWVAADPTNRALAGETHVNIGHGRFYGDVAPIRGVYRGSAGEAEHEVRVTMTRLTS